MGELKAVIQKLGYAGCRPTPLCFDVTGDITTGMLILVSGMMIKKGGAPEEYCQTFYFKREIVEGVARKPVIEQDILRYTGSNKEAYTTFMSALSDTEQKNQAKSFEISDSSVVSTKAVSEKTNGEVSVKSVSVSSKEAKEGNDSGPNDD